MNLLSSERGVHLGSTREWVEGKLGGCVCSCVHDTYTSTSKTCSVHIRWVHRVSESMGLGVSKCALMSSPHIHSFLVYTEKKIRIGLYRHTMGWCEQWWMPKIIRALMTLYFSIKSLLSTSCHTLARTRGLGYANSGWRGGGVSHWIPSSKN